MIWALVVVTVATLVIVLQLLLQYKSQAHKLRVRQEPIRRRIREHLSAMDEATRKIQEAIPEQLQGFEEESEEIKAAAGEMAKVLEEMQSQQHEEVTEEATEEATDVETAATPDDGDEGQQDEEHELTRRLTEAAYKRDEVDRELNSLAKEIHIVNSSRSRLEAMLQRDAAPGKGKKKRKAAGKA